MNVTNLITISLLRGNFLKNWSYFMPVCECLPCMYTMCMPSIQEGQKTVSDGNDHIQPGRNGYTQHASVIIYIFINK